MSTGADNPRLDYTADERQHQAAFRRQEATNVLIQFDHEFDLPVEEAYPYFRTPKDWPRLFGSFGEVEDRGQGWYAVPLRKFPFPLVAKITRDEPLSCVEWVFRGFWRGEGQVSFVATSRGVTIRGFERISARPLGWLAPLVEPLLLEKRFQRVWDSGWRNLRRAAQSEGGKRDGQDRARTIAKRTFLQ